MHSPFSGGVGMFQCDPQWHLPSGENPHANFMGTCANSALLWGHEAEGSGQHEAGHLGKEFYRGVQQFYGGFNRIYLR